VSASRWVRAQWDRVLGGALFAAGALALIIGWVRVSEQILTVLQMPYVVSGGLGGIFLLGLGSVFWLSADMRDEWRKLDAIERNTRPATMPTSADRLAASRDCDITAEPAANSSTPHGDRVRPVRAREQ